MISRPFIHFYSLHPPPPPQQQQRCYDEEDNDTDPSRPYYLVLLQEEGDDDAHETEKNEVAVRIVGVAVCCFGYIHHEMEPLCIWKYCLPLLLLSMILQLQLSNNNYCMVSVRYCQRVALFSHCVADNGP